MTEMSLKDGLNAMEVASYLRRNPEFLKDFPDLGMTLHVPREQGATTSLASYQLEVLRDKNRDLTRRLHELVEIAGENEQLMVRVHTLTVGLMRERTLAGYGAPHHRRPDARISILIWCVWCCSAAMPTCRSPTG